MKLSESLSLAALLTSLACVSSVPSSGGGSSPRRTSPGRNTGNRNTYSDPCSNFRCENGGSCSTDGEGRAHCHCSRGYSGQRCETRASTQPTQSITNLRCDNACSTATSCRICLPCETCQFQTMCLAYEILVKALDAECHAQGYQEALLMASTNSALGYTQIKCRGSGPTRDCPQGSACVDDGRGGGTCCRNRVGRQALENKQGSCPAVAEVQTCGRLSCQGDIDCAGNLKCCQRCGNRCTNPNNNPVISRDPCVYFTCQNGGRCTAPADAPYCECPTGFSGRNCEIRQDPCQNMRCLNGARCLTQGTQAFCQCTQGFTGQYCDTREDPCQNMRCLNGARCLTQGTQAFCQCTQGFTGQYCDTREETCQNFGCLNGGRCVMQGGRPSCECPRDYRGPRCGIRDDPCASFRCENGGRCVTRGDEPSCQCREGFRGPRCGIRDRDVVQDPCRSLACQNGGRCVAQGTSAYCQCPRGYTGSRCEGRGGSQPTRSPCQLFGGCDNTSSDRCGGCPDGLTCQYISTGCPTLNCPPAYRCVYRQKK
ncbi:hypothetical protein BsWGS_12048 [Bradybaena similaris]